MSVHDVLRSPASSALLVDLAIDHGMTEAEVLAGTTLTRDGLNDLDAEVIFRDELRIITNIVHTLENTSTLGIEAGLRCHATSPGIWGLALMSSRTVREAVSIGVSLAKLSFCLCRLQIDTDTTDGSARLVLDPGDLPARIRQFAVDRDSVGIRTLQRDLLTAPGVTLTVTYTADAPAPNVLQDYVDVFGAPPIFGADQNALIVDSALLDIPLPKANAYAKSLAVSQAMTQLRQRSERAGVSGLIRELIISKPSPLLSLEEIARELTISSRTLRRHLALEGASLRALQEEVREAIAEELLIGEGVPVAEIAGRLGYSQVSGFTQAFRRWKGVGPREYRQQKMKP